MAIPATLSSVPAATPYIQYIATNGQTLFPYPFPITQDSDLIVVVNGVTLNTDTGYSLSGQGNPTGGDLTFTLGQTAGAIITLYRDITIERITQFSQNSGFSSTAFNAEYNNIYLILQQLQEQLGFTLQVPNTNSPAPVTTLQPSSYANKYLSFDAYGNPTPAALVAGTITQAIIAGLLTPAIQSEINAGVTIVAPWYGVGNVLRYGLVPNSSGAAGSNTTIIKALLSPSVANGPSGYFWFPNTTGSDTYYFSNVIPMRDGCHIDLGGCIITNTTAVDASATNTGLFFCLRDTIIENGTINIAQDTSLATSSGYAIQLGARGTDSTYFTIYDSLLSKPMGNIILRNLRIKVSNTGSNMAFSGCINGLGGLQNVLFENVVMDGNSTAAGGFQYEFGWATSGTTNLRQTSHANNLVLRNVTVQNLSASIGIGIVMAGAYNFTIDGLVVRNAFQVGTFTPGEAMYYRPWVGVDDVGAKRTKVLRNIVGEGIVNGPTLTGSYLASGGYLSAIIAGLGHPADYIAQTDLADYVVDGFAMTGTNSGDGFVISAGRADIRNGTASGFLQAVFMTDECTWFTFDNCRFINSGQEGINLNGGGNIWPTDRLKTGIIRNCFIAGNSTASANFSPGLRVANTASLLIENCRFNYEAAHDGADETTQGNAIQLATTALGVTCRDNYVGHVLGGSFAYSNANSAGTLNGNTIENPRGTLTTTGTWNFDGTGVATTTQLGTAAGNVNTYGKYFGRRVINGSNNRLVIATGPGTTDNWAYCDGNAPATITPS